MASLGELMAQWQPQANAGALALGDLLGGGPAQRARDAGVLGMERRARLDQIFERAREAQRRGIAQDTLAPALGQLGIAQPEAASTVMLSGIPLRNVTAGLGDLIDQKLTEHAAALADSGDVDALNRLNAVRGGKLIPRADVQGNAVIDPYRAPEAQTVALTPLGDAMAGAQRAQAGKYGAEAGAAAALADRRRAETAEVGKTASEKPEPAAPSDAEALAQARALIAQGKDPRVVAAYLVKKGYPRAAAQLVGSSDAYLQQGEGD